MVRKYSAITLEIFVSELMLIKMSGASFLGGYFYTLGCVFGAILRKSWFQRISRIVLVELARAY